MGKPHPVELRQRVVDFVAAGNTPRSAAARFRVSGKFVNGRVKLKPATGSLAPKPQGNGGGHGKQSGPKAWVVRRIGQKRDLTAADLAAGIGATHGTAVHRSPVWRLLRDLGLRHERPAGRRAAAPPRSQRRGTSGSPSASPSWPTC